MALNPFSRPDSGLWGFILSEAVCFAEFARDSFCSSLSFLTYDVGSLRGIQVDLRYPISRKYLCDQANT